MNGHSQGGHSRKKKGNQQKGRNIHQPNVCKVSIIWLTKRILAVQQQRNNVTSKKMGKGLKKKFSQNKYVND